MVHGQFFAGPIRHFLIRQMRKCHPNLQSTFLSLFRSLSLSLSLSRLMGKVFFVAFSRRSAVKSSEIMNDWKAASKLSQFEDRSFRVRWQLTVEAMRRKMKTKMTSPLMQLASNWFSCFALIWLRHTGLITSHWFAWSLPNYALWYLDDGLRGSLSSYMTVGILKVLRAVVVTSLQTALSL